MNEVESGTQRLSRGASTGARSAWNWFSDLGQGAWLLTISVLVVAGIALAVVEGRGGASTCDRALRQANQVRLYDGNTSLLDGAQHELHLAATQLDLLAGEATGAQRQALQALAEDARSARTNQPFHAKSQLAALHDACS